MQVGSKRWTMNPNALHVLDTLVAKHESYFKTMQLLSAGLMVQLRLWLLRAAILELNPPAWNWVSP